MTGAGERPLVWFRSDLRVADNPALHAACSAAQRGVVGVISICAKQWREHDWADVKVEFLLRNLAALAEELQRLNIPLRINEAPTFDEVPAALLRLAEDLESTALYFNKEYEVNEAGRDEAVRDLIERSGRKVHAYDDQTILPPDFLRTSDGKFYKVFTPFRRAWLAAVDAQGPAAPLAAPRKQPALVCRGDRLPKYVDGFDLTNGKAYLWPAGEQHALRQLERFVAHSISAYKSKRDEPAADSTSKLSPYLTLGVISPRTCLEAALAANRGRLAAGRVGPSTWINELIWREFYRHVLVGFRRVSMQRAFVEATDELPWRSDEEQFEAWCTGRTGFPIVDAGMRQLLETGWMHNRVRMITAMFLTKDLFIDWRWGERWFMRHLIDGDLANNNGGWQWSASTGTDAAPYFRVFNPYSQSRKFDPAGDYIRRFVPELAEVAAAALHDPKKFPAQERAGRGYPAPLCDHAPARKYAIEAFQRLKK